MQSSCGQLRQHTSSFEEILAVFMTDKIHPFQSLGPGLLIDRAQLSSLLDRNIHIELQRETSYEVVPVSVERIFQCCLQSLQESYENVRISLNGSSIAHVFSHESFYDIDVRVVVPLTRYEEKQRIKQGYHIKWSIIEGIKRAVESVLSSTLSKSTILFEEDNIFLSSKQNTPFNLHHLRIGSSMKIEFSCFAILRDEPIQFRSFDFNCGSLELSPSEEGYRLGSFEPDLLDVLTQLRQRMLCCSFPEQVTRSGLSRYLRKVLLAGYHSRDLLFEELLDQQMAASITGVHGVIDSLSTAFINKGIHKWIFLLAIWLHPCKTAPAKTFLSFCREQLAKDSEDCRNILANKLCAFATKREKCTVSWILLLCSQSIELVQSRGVSCLKLRICSTQLGLEKPLIPSLFFTLPVTFFRGVTRDFSFLDYPFCQLDLAASTFDAATRNALIDLLQSVFCKEVSLYNAHQIRKKFSLPADEESMNNLMRGFNNLTSAEKDQLPFSVIADFLHFDSISKLFNASEELLIKIVIGLTEQSSIENEGHLLCFLWGILKAKKAERSSAQVIAVVSTCAKNLIKKRIKRNQLFSATQSITEEDKFLLNLLYYLSKNETLSMRYTVFAIDKCLDCGDWDRAGKLFSLTIGKEHLLDVKKHVIGRFLSKNLQKGLEKTRPFTQDHEADLLLLEVVEHIQDHQQDIASADAILDLALFFQHHKRMQQYLFRILRESLEYLPWQKTLLESFFRDNSGLWLEEYSLELLKKDSLYFLANVFEKKQQRHAQNSLLLRIHCALLQQKDGSRFLSFLESCLRASTEIDCYLPFFDHIELFAHEKMIKVIDFWVLAVEEERFDKLSPLFQKMLEKVLSSCVYLHQASYFREDDLALLIRLHKQVFALSSKHAFWQLFYSKNKVFLSTIPLEEAHSHSQIATILLNPEQTTDWSSLTSYQISLQCFVEMLKITSKFSVHSRQKLHHFLVEAFLSMCKQDNTEAIAASKELEEGMELFYEAISHHLFCHIGHARGIEIMDAILDGMQFLSLYAAQHIRTAIVAQLIQGTRYSDAHLEKLLSSGKADVILFSCLERALTEEALAEVRLYAQVFCEYFCVDIRSVSLLRKKGVSLLTQDSSVSEKRCKLWFQLISKTARGKASLFREGKPTDEIICLEFFVKYLVDMLASLTHELSLVSAKLSQEGPNQEHLSELSILLNQHKGVVRFYIGQLLEFMGRKGLYEAASVYFNFMHGAPNFSIPDLTWLIVKITSSASDILVKLSQLDPANDRWQKGKDLISCLSVMMTILETQEKKRIDFAKISKFLEAVHQFCSHYPLDRIVDERIHYFIEFFESLSSKDEMTHYYIQWLRSIIERKDSVSYSETALFAHLTFRLDPAMSSEVVDPARVTQFEDKVLFDEYFLDTPGRMLLFIELFSLSFRRFLSEIGAEDMPFQQLKIDVFSLFCVYGSAIQASILRLKNKSDVMKCETKLIEALRYPLEAERNRLTLSVVRTAWNFILSKHPDGKISLRIHYKDRLRFYAETFYAIVEKLSTTPPETLANFQISSKNLKKAYQTDKELLLRYLSATQRQTIEEFLSRKTEPKSTSSALKKVVILTQEDSASSSDSYQVPQELGASSSKQLDDQAGIPVSPVIGFEYFMSTIRSRLGIPSQSTT